jgi:hypothetical protein
MPTRALFVAAGLLVASFGPALSDNVTAAVTDWDARSRTITLEDKSQFMAIPDKIAVPPSLKAGDEVMIDFESSENGIEAINRIDIIREFAKRQQPLPIDKRG